MTELQAENRDIDVIHEFTDFYTFTYAAYGAALLGQDFDIATEIREIKSDPKSPVAQVRYWMVIIH